MDHTMFVEACGFFDPSIFYQAAVLDEDALDGARAAARRRAESDIKRAAAPFDGARGGFGKGVAVHE